MDITNWERMAQWWDDKLGDDGDLWHRALIDPTVFRLAGDVTGQRVLDLACGDVTGQRVLDLACGNVTGQRVLDLACGNGYISRRFARAGGNVVGVDSSGAIVERARAREAREPLGITYHVADAADLEMLEDGAFDLVVCNMALMDIADADAAIEEVARVLVPDGRFVASIAHPCFDKMETSGWAIERIYPTTTIWRKMSRYRELAVEHVPWPQAGDPPIITLAYHRPLSWYFRALRAAGLFVAALEEPEPDEEFLAKDEQGAWIAEIPLHCVIEAWKLERSLPK